MGWFDGSSSVGNNKRSHSHSHTHKERKDSSHSSNHSHSHGHGHSTSHEKKHSSPKTPSIFEGILGGEMTSHSQRHSHHEKERERGSSNRSSPTRGLGGIFGSGNAHHNSSRASFFNFGSSRPSTSHYKRSPRPNYLKKTFSKLRRLLRDLISYMKKNPLKVFMLVIMPLITGGALTGLLHKFGIRLPAGMEKLFGGGSQVNGGGSSTGSGSGISGGKRESVYERTSIRGERAAGGGALETLGTMASLANNMGGVSSAMSLAKMFM